MNELLPDLIEKVILVFNECFPRDVNVVSHIPNMIKLMKKLCPYTTLEVFLVFLEMIPREEVFFGFQLGQKFLDLIDDVHGAN